jgi:hypothetical protein
MCSRAACSDLPADVGQDTREMMLLQLRRHLSPQTLHYRMFMLSADTHDRPG